MALVAVVVIGVGGAGIWAMTRPKTAEPVNVSTPSTDEPAKSGIAPVSENVNAGRSPAAQSDLTMVPGNVRECLEAALGAQVYQAIAAGRQTADPAQQGKITECLGPAAAGQGNGLSADGVVPGGMTENVVAPGVVPQGGAAGGPAAGSPAAGGMAQRQSVPEELSSASGTLAYCFRGTLDSAFDALASGERTPTPAEEQSMMYCRTMYIQPELVSCNASDEFSYSYLGSAVTYAQIPGIDGYVADPSAVVLSDGRVRLYFSAGRDLMSAVTPDVPHAPYTDISFVLEEGSRIPDGYGHPRVVLLPDGSYRMYARGSDQTSIRSFVSSDAFNFTEEEGIRLSASDLGMDYISGPGVVKVGSAWKMYVSNVFPPGFDPSAIDSRPPIIIKSATSTDMLNWSVDDGIRFGLGAATAGFTPDDRGRTMSTEHASAVLVDGKVFVAFRGTNAVCGARSTDAGVSFDHPILLSEEQVDGDQFSGGDPDLLELAEGVYLLTGSAGGPTPDSRIKMGILRSN